MKNICVVMVIMLSAIMNVSAVTFSKVVLTPEEWDEAVRSGKMQMGLRACPYEREEFARNRHLFPSDWIFSGEVVKINDLFLLNKGDCDLWREYLPLLETMVRCQESVGFEAAKSKEVSVMEYFMRYAFANEEESSIVKADFSGRLLCLEQFLNFYVVRNDVEMLYQIAEWIGRSKFLPDGDLEYNAEIRKACIKDLELVFDVNVIPLFDIDNALKNIQGPRRERVNSIFKFRKVYNKRLREFREKALVMIREAIMDYSPKYYKMDSEEVWEGFCKRGNIPNEERINVESIVKAEKKGTALKTEAEAMGVSVGKLSD